MNTYLKNCEDPNINSIESGKNTLIEQLKKCLFILSNRIRTLQEYIVKRKLAVQNLLKKVEGLWKESTLANAISYVQTQIIKSEKCVERLLQHNDELGFFISILNGTCDDYRLGSGTIDLGKQQNFICLIDQSHESVTSENPEHIKQRSPAWDDLRKNAKVTGSSLYKALGMRSLKEQKEHFDKVYDGVVNPITPETQKRFDYGTENELHALATLVGKVIPIFYPQVKFREDGCVCLPLDDKGNYAVISGDETGIHDGTSKVAFEPKMSDTWKGLFYRHVLSITNILHDTDFESNGSQEM